jgi:hypothetical protein
LERRQDLNHFDALYAIKFSTIKGMAEHGIQGIQHICWDSRHCCFSRNNRTSRGLVYCVFMSRRINLHPEPLSQALRILGIAGDDKMTQLFFGADAFSATMVFDGEKALRCVSQGPNLDG